MDVDLSDLSRWARGSGLEIVMLLTGSILLARTITWTGGRISRSVQQRSMDEPVVSELAKHRRALIEVVTWALIVVTYFVTFAMVLSRLNVPLSSLAIPATALGVALGFGAQRLVADLLSGFFLIAERQFGFGDEIRIAAPGSVTGVTGVVEEITLRTTRLRTLEGEQLIIPNGEIRQVTNLSREWARAVIDVPVPIDSDLDVVNETLERVGGEAMDDAVLAPLLLEAPVVMGVQSIELGYAVVRVTARTLPGKQFKVARAMRTRIVVELRRDGIEVGTPTGTGTAGGAAT